MATGADGGARSHASSLRAHKRRQRSELREQVLAAARAIMAADGPDNLSMRKLAQHLDCAPMSLYSYFRDKHDILLALANQSFEALARRLAAEKASLPLDALRKLYLAYARLGLERPDDYRIIFMTPEAQPPREGKNPDDIYRENPAFAVSLDRVTVCIEAGALQGDAHAIATLLWTTVHGAVSAILAFPAFPFGDPETYVTRVVDWSIGAVSVTRTVPLAADDIKNRC